MREVRIEHACLPVSLIMQQQRPLWCHGVQLGEMRSNSLDKAVMVAARSSVATSTCPRFSAQSSALRPL